MSQNEIASMMRTQAAGSLSDPLAAGPFLTEEPPRPKHRRWDGRRWLILLVEDDGDISDAARGVLQDEDYDVVGADNGNAALKWLQGNVIPDLIVLDLRMPVMDGWEFRAQQKGDPRLSDIPIIACSADTSPQAVTISADAYLRKPIEAALLVSTVARILHQQEMKHMTQRLESAERLASLGRLAAGVGHEINNPLAFATLNVSMALKQVSKLRDKLAAPPAPGMPAGEGDGSAEAFADVLSMLSDSEVGLERIRQTVGRLQKLSRDVQKRHEPFDLNAVIDQSIAMVWTQIQHRARLSKDYRRSETIVNGDAVAIGQVFLNLLVNAAQAIPDGDADHNEIGIKVEVVRDEVVVEIRDTGAGISRENLPRIFEPFFSTKPTGSGTGLGLSIARQTMNDNHGRIVFDSAPAQGTTVRVFLPFFGELNTDKPEARPAAAGKEGPERSLPDADRGRVLVIDDEPLIGRVIQSALRDEHDVVVETRAADALARLEKGERFDLILCDMAMPNIGGPEVFAIISTRWPDLASRLVFITGGSFTASARAFLDNTTATILPKPFTAEEIRRLARARTLLAQVTASANQG
jgi:signal transduction histidine kinase